MTEVAPTTPRRVLMATLINYEEKARDAFYGCSVYATSEALLRVFLQDWENEREFDLEQTGKLDTSEVAEINANYDEQIVEFKKWYGEGLIDAVDEQGHSVEYDWYNENTGVTYHIAWRPVEE